MKNMEELRKDIRFDAAVRGVSLSFRTTWGLFSPKKIDEGTELLLNRISVRPDQRSIDLGCGYGPIGLFVAANAPQGETHLVDKDFVALRYAALNAEANRLRGCRIYPSNGLENIEGERSGDGSFDAIYSNLPAKVGREQLSLFLCDAERLLKPGGTLSVVTILGLKEYIKRNFREVFGNYGKLKQSPRYVAAQCAKEA